MVTGITPGGSIGVAAITALRYAQRDDVLVPVRRAEQLYANFRHIQVRPSSGGEDGVPLYKLRVLDSLIDSLSREEGAAEGNPRIRAAYRAGFLPEPGAFVDLVA